MGKLIRTYDWHSTSLGSPDRWPPSLKAAVELTLETPLVSSVVVGPERLLLYNDAAAALYGDRHPRALGRPLSETFPEAAAVADHYDRAFAGESVTVREQPLDVSGEGHGEVFDAYLTPVRDEAGAIVAVAMFGVEVGKRVRAEAQRKAVEDRLRRVLDTDAVGVIFFNKDGVVIDSNNAFLKMTGYTRDDIAAGALDWRRMTPAEWVAASEEQMERLEETGRLGPYEKEYFTADGGRRWMLFAGRDLGDGTISEYCMDISDRKRAENALRESDALRRVALAGGRMGAWRWDLPAALIWGDPQFWALWGYPPSDEPRPLSDFNHRMSAESAADVATVVASAIEAGEQFDGLLEIVTGPTAGHWLRWQGRADGDSTALLFGVTFDVTDQKQAETALRESEERQTFLLELSDALRSLTDPGEIERQATRLLGEHLKADRCFLSPVYEDGLGMCVREEYLRAGASSVLGDYTFAQFGDFVGPELHAGRILAVEDVTELTSLSAAERESYAAVEIAAYLLVPVTRDGRLAAFLTINHRTPRKWSDADKAVARQTADRLWTARERGRIETALRTSEDNYRTLFDTIDEGFAEVDLITDDYNRVVDWRYLRLNPAFTRLTGMADVTGRLISDILPDLEPAWAERYTQMFKSGESVRFEEFAGSLGLWFEVYASLVGGADSRRAVLVYNNITERKRAEQALRESEERQRLMVELVPALLWSASSDGQHVSLNERWLAYTGQSEASTQNYGWLNAIHPDDLPETRAAFEHAFATGEPLERQHRIRKANDGYRWHLVRHVPVRDSQGAIIRWFGAAVDINEGKLAEQALQESEERQTFLLKLTDALRPLQDAGEIQQAAIELLGEHLAVNRAGYYEVGSDQDLFFLTARWEHGAVPLPEQMLITDFGEEIRDGYMAGRTMVMRDTELEAVSTENLAAVRAVQIRAWIGVPLVKQGRWVAAIGVHSVVPRDWTAAEIALVEEVGDRTWAATERARVEQALRASEEHQKTLLAELQHRVRNTIGIIRSIARRTGKTSDNIEEMSQLLDGRLAAFARVQAAVTRDPTAGVDLRALIDDEVQAVDVPDGHAVTIAGPEVHLAPRAAESVSLAIHELVTNAVKHGAMAIKGGKIDVHWSVEPRDGRDWLTLEWIESGLAARPKPRREGFGHELLRRKLPYDTGGKTQIDIRPDGLCFSITMPLSSRKSDAG